MQKKFEQTDVHNNYHLLELTHITRHPCYGYNVNRDGYLALAGPEPLTNVNANEHDHHDDNDNHNHYYATLALLFRDGYLALAGPKAFDKCQ